MVIARIVEICAKAGIELKREVKLEILENLNLKGFGANASQFKQFMTAQKGDKAADGAPNDPYKIL